MRSLSVLGPLTEKAAAELGWKPQVTFRELVRIMVEEDIRAMREHTDYRFR